MKAISKKLLSLLVVIALVLPMVPAIALPASAATPASAPVYGSTNLDAIADASEKALVQERIALLEQMIADPAAAMQQMANYCPICETTVEWTEWTEPVAVSGGNQQHLIVSSDRTIEGAWPLEFYGDAASAHVLLAADVTLKGPILCNTGCTNTDITIFGTGSITSNRMFRPLGSAKLTLIGGTYTATSATYPVIDGTVLEEGAEINIYPHTVIGPATKDAEVAITNIIAQQATINMYGGEIRNGQQKTAELGGNIGLKTKATFNMYGGTVSNGSNTAAKGGNIASYSSNAVINIWGGTVSGGSGATGANLYGFGKINIGGTALITGATATGDGGNVYQTGGQTLSISGGKIEGGSAAYGGNVYIAGTAKLNMTGGEIANGTAVTRGGNIFTDAGVTVDIKNATISGGSAPSGASVSSSANVTIADTTITGGVATGESGMGGNLYLNGTGKTALLTNVTVSDGGAFIGGNAYFTANTTIADNCTFDEPKDQEYGSVSVYWDAKMVMNGGTISSAKNAVRVAGSQFVLAGDAAVTGAPAIFVDGTSTLAVDTGWTGTAQVKIAKDFELEVPLMNSEEIPAAVVGTLGEDYTFTPGGALNAAATLSNGQYLLAVADETTGVMKYATPPEAPEYVKINDSVHMNPETGAIEEHAAGCTECGERPENFCPVCNDTVAWTDLVTGTANLKTSGANHYHVRVQGDQTITNNWPFDIYGDGGKIHVLLAGNLNLTGPIFFNGTSNNYDLTIFGSGNVHSTSRLFHLKNDNKITLIGGTYTQDSVNYSMIDAVNATENAQINIYSGTVLGNAERKEEVRSEVISLKNGTLNMYGGTIRNGYYATGSGFSGGNVQLLENATFNMYGGTITGGKSTGDGGNVYVSAGATMNMSGGTIEKGAAGYGANIYVTATSKLNITGGKIAEGVAAQAGGNLYYEAAAETVKISNATIIDGVARHGGNIYDSRASIEITDSTITGGVANAVDAEGTLTGQGGNIYIRENTPMATISGCTISGGTASIGAAIYADKSTVIITDTTIGAEEETQYANVAAYWGTKMAVIGGSISSNVVGIRAASSQVMLAGNVSVTGGTDTAQAAVFVDGASTLAVDKAWTGSATVYFAKRNEFTAGEPLMNSETTPAAIVGTLDITNTAEPFAPGGALAGTLTASYGHQNAILTLDAASGALTIEAVDCVPEVIPGKEPTATEPGLTEGSKCSVCGKILVEQEEIPVIEEHEHTWGEWVIDKAATRTETGLKHHECSVCGETEEKVIPQTLRMSGAGLTLSDGILLSVKMPKTTVDSFGYTDAYLQVVLNGTPYTVTEYRADGNNYVFDFSELSPAQLGDVMDISLHATFEGEAYATAVTQYSVWQYCEGQLTKSTTKATLKTLLVDMLNYGAAAQQYVDYKLDDLITDRLTAEQKAWGTQADTAAVNELKQAADNAAPTVQWKGGKLLLGQKVTVVVTIQVDNVEGFAVVMTDAYGNEYTYTAEDLKPVSGYTNRYTLEIGDLGVGQMRDKATFVAYQNGVQASKTLTYSIQSYVATSGTGTSELAVLLRAMLRYGDAAKAYAVG